MSSSFHSCRLHQHCVPVQACQGMLCKADTYTMMCTFYCRRLAEFEESGHKKCVLHKARAKRVEPLLREINPAAFSSLYKSLQLEVASAYREIMEIKFDEGRPFEKVLLFGPCSDTTWLL